MEYEIAPSEYSPQILPAGEAGPPGQPGAASPNPPPITLDAVHADAVSQGLIPPIQQQGDKFIITDEEGTPAVYDNRQEAVQDALILMTPEQRQKVQAMVEAGQEKKPAYPPLPTPELANAPSQEADTNPAINRDISDVVNPNGQYYSTMFEVALNQEDYGRSRSVHFNRANAALDSAIAKDTDFASQLEQLIPDVKQAVAQDGGRETPEGWVWHHDIGNGIMQLVPEEQHTPGSNFWKTLHPDGRGGYSLWGIPNGSPPNK